MVFICLGGLKVFCVCTQVCGMYACVFTSVDVHAYVYVHMHVEALRSVRYAL